MQSQAAQRSWPCPRVQEDTQAAARPHAAATPVPSCPHTCQVVCVAAQVPGVVCRGGHDQGCGQLDLQVQPGRGLSLCGPKRYPKTPKPQNPCYF